MAVSGTAASASAWENLLAGFGQLRQQEMMARHTTLGVGGPARWFFRPHSHEDLLAAIQTIPADISILPLGRGSNMLVSDDGVDGLVLDLSKLDAIQIEDRYVTAGTGVRMGKLAQTVAQNGLAGLEFMATVPGNVGGGIAMNAGAFGQQISDTLVSIEIIERGSRSRQVDAEELHMAYRRTQLPAGALVVSATFELKSDDPAVIRKRMRYMRQTRSTSQPLAQPNCGSVFKNPPQDHAARLIEAAGLKGKRIGGARISDMHANFIINDGNATSQDILELIRTAQMEVEAQFDVRLEPEVRIVGLST
ncbi:MAG: UDP-N-acetylmuramate dehydrogenase [Mariprofundaceae bacterium]